MFYTESAFKNAEKEEIFFLAVERADSLVYWILASGR